MDSESMKRLKLDRRLIRRRGWLSKEELERALAELPDVSDKVAPAEAASGGPVAPAVETPPGAPAEVPAAD